MQDLLQGTEGGYAENYREFQDVTNGISQDILERKYDALHAFVEASNAQVISKINY